MKWTYLHILTLDTLPPLVLICQCQERGGVVIGGDEEEGVATDEDEGPEAGTRRRAWRRGRWRGRGGGRGGFVFGEEEGLAAWSSAETRRRVC